jgi:hypothetical protein
MARVSEFGLTWSSSAFKGGQPTVLGCLWGSKPSSFSKGPRQAQICQILKVHLDLVAVSQAWHVVSEGGALGIHVLAKQ